jgi:hypothetical protein
MMKKLLGTLLPGICLMFSSAAADAGQRYGMTYNCVVNNNVPNCYGSLRAANLSAGATDRAEFRLSQSGTLSFFANYSGNSYSCSFDATPSAALGSAIVSGNFNTYFNLKIDGNGKCTSAYISNSSVYQHLLAPQ